MKFILVKNDDKKLWKVAKITIAVTLLVQRVIETAEKINGMLIKKGVYKDHKL